MDGDVKEARIYQKEDFLSGTGPFEEVYKYKDDPFEMKQKLEIMNDIAKACGVRNYKGLFKEYTLKLKSVTNDIYTENLTDFEGQPLQLNCGTWHADDNGITREGAYGMEFVACVHPLIPIERLVNVDSGIEKLRIAFRKGYQWRNMIFDRRQLASASAIVGLADYGIAVTSENAKFMVQYIHDIENLNYNVIPEHSSVSRLGWIGEDMMFSPYVENLIFDADISYKHIYDAVQGKGLLSEWLDHVRKIRAENNTLTKIALAASFASVLVEPCGCNCFFVHFWNGSGNGKTVALMLAASVWANPRVGEYITTFNSTAVGQELMAGFVNSLPLIMDELQIQSGERRDFDKIIYKLSEGAGRDRGAKSGGLQRKATWRNCILTSGEAPITSAHSGAGAVNRIIEINSEGSSFFKNAGQTAKFLSKCYGRAGKEFVKILQDPDMLQYAKDAQSGYFEELSKGDISEKQVMAASLILAADEIATNMIFKDGAALTMDEVSQFLATHSEVSSDARAYDWLCDWLAQNGKRFVETDNSLEIWGRIDGNRTLIIRNVFDKACIEAGYNPSSFLGWLKRKQMIETEGKALTKRLRISGTRCQCVVLKTDMTPAQNFDGAIPDGFNEIPKEEEIAF